MVSLTTRELFRKYRAVIIAVILFLITDIGVMGTNIYSSFKIAESAVSINLSGRQRMLSQRTTKVLLSLQDDQRRDEPLEADLKELRLVVPLFDTTLAGFRDGGTVTGGDGRPTHLVKVETPEAERIVQDTYQVWGPYLKKLEPLLKRDDFSEEQLAEAAVYARANNLKVLGLMNDLTSDLETVANARAERLRWIQIVGLIFALLNVVYTVFKSVSDLIKSDRALTQARKETGDILETVKEGLFLIDHEYRIGSQHSKSLSSVLRRDVEPNMPFLPVLEGMVPPAVYGDAKDYIELLFGDRVKEALVLSLNPLSQVEVQGEQGKLHYLSFHFNRVLEEGKIAHLLVTVQDVTELVELTEKLELTKGQARIEVEVLLKLLRTDSTVLRQFLDNVDKGLAQINERLRSEDDSEQSRMHLLNFIMRTVHSIKGEAAALGIEMFEAYAHAFEKEMVVMRDRGEVRGDDMVRITVLLDGFYERLASITGIVERMVGVGSGDADEKYVQTFAGSLHNLAGRIAHDEHKKVAVVCDLDDLAYLPRRVGNELHGMAIQLLRNAVKHGIETTHERTALDKPEQGEIHIGCRTTGRDEYEFTVRDNGRGMSINSIRQNLIDSGRFSSDEVAALPADAVVLHLFDPGYSTARGADRDAGHGMGLDVVAEKVLMLRGKLSLSSKPHEFTEFKIRFAV